MTRTVAFVGACVVAIAISLAVRSLQRQNDQMLEELTRIRQLLERVPGADRVTLANLSGEFLGRADAPLTMVEYTDLQCPFCREFHTTAFEQIKREYIDTGKLRYFSREFPLESIHPQAVASIHADHCAGQQGKFWDMRHAILARNKTLKADSFVGFARELRLDMTTFDACIADAARTDMHWRDDLEEGKRVGVSGTPAFVIGRTTPGGVDGVRMTGAKPYSAFEDKFKELLGS
jgi:protein-disulfide isomerase